MNSPFKGLNLSQLIFGLGNSQNLSFVTNEQKRIVEILPNDIELILDAIINPQIDSSRENDISPPDLDKKNRINGIKINQYKIIQNDYTQFGKIDQVLRNNSNRDIREKYFAAARILHLQYVTDFEGKMPEFIVQALAAHSRRNHLESGVIAKMHLLLNYMYCSCDIGVKPDENQ